MIQLQQILVPTDFGETADLAIGYGAVLARTFHASLHLLHVLDDALIKNWQLEIYFPSLPNVCEELKAKAVARLAGTAPEPHGEALTTQRTARWGKPAEEVLRYAQDQAVDLIVIGTHGRSPLPRLLLGSVAENVVRRAPCPVLTVRQTPGIKEPTMIALKRILVATDFSEASQNALRYARAFADQFGAAIDVLHVLDDPFVYAPPLDTVVPPPSFYEELQNAARERLGQVVSEAERARYKARVVLKMGRPFAEILAYAQEQAVDLIVMGTHGRGPVAHALLGSVTERVVRRAPCPVLTVRHPEHEFVPP
jgi:nucleotide-binding universal stress UspA family protein